MCKKDAEVAMCNLLSQDLALFNATVIQQYLHVRDPLSELPPPVRKYSLHRRNAHCQSREKRNTTTTAPPQQFKILDSIDCPLSTHTPRRTAPICLPVQCQPVTHELHTVPFSWIMQSLCNSLSTPQTFQSATLIPTRFKDGLSTLFVRYGTAEGHKKCEPFDETVTKKRRHIWPHATCVLQEAATGALI